MGLSLQTVEYNDNGGGLDLISSMTKGEEDISTDNLNIDYSVDGAVLTRNGSSRFNTTQISGAPRTLAAYDYWSSTGTNVQVICAGTKIYHSLSSPSAIVTGLSSGLEYPDLEFIVTNNEELLIWGNGIDNNLKFDGTNWTNLSYPAPSALTFNAVGDGALPKDTYDYYVSFARTISGVIAEEGPLSPVYSYTASGDTDYGQATAGTANDLTDTTKIVVSSQATAGGNNFLTDTTIYMANNSYVDYYLNIVGGTGSGQSIRIISNTNDTFTVATNWAVNPDAHSVYEVSKWGTNFWAAKKVYITSGTGVGQAATIASNTSSVLTFAAPMGTPPDSTSQYAINTISITLNVPTAADTNVNARVLYRKKNSTGVVYRLTDTATITNNTTTTYTDNITEENLSSIEADFNNDEAPKSAVFEEFNGKIFYRDENSKSDYLKSVAYKPWSVYETTRTILDGEIRCMKKIFGVIVIGTDKSIWFEDSAGNVTRLTSKIGMLNNHCADGEAGLYFISTSRKLYVITPTDLSQTYFRLSEPVSFKVDPLFAQIGGSADTKLCLKYFTKANEAKVVIACPVGSTNNNAILIYNERQSMIKGKPVWQRWDNLNACALSTFTINSELQLMSGDYNGFLWKLNDATMTGDGFEDNGTATSATATQINDTTKSVVTGTATSGGANTLVDTSKSDTGTATSGAALTLSDTSKTWVVNYWANSYVSISGGTGAGQTRLVSSNTANTLTVSAAWTTNPDNTSVYTVGWLTNQWSTLQVYITGGTGAGQNRVVAVNSDNTLTVTVPWTIAPDATSTYSLDGWPVNGLIGVTVTIVDGTGEGQTRTIISNTDTQLTTAAWTQTPDSTSVYTIGGFKNYHYSNWKAVMTSYEALKQLWYFWLNANASGDYNIKLIMQIDFDTTVNNQIVLLVNLKSQNTIWGAFLWGNAPWGSRSVFLDRFRKYTKFRAVRFAFYHDRAGQPWQMNNYAVSAQDKNLYFKKT